MSVRPSLFPHVTGPTLNVLAHLHEELPKFLRVFQGPRNEYLTKRNPFPTQAVVKEHRHI